MLILGQLKTSSVANVAGVDVNSPQFAQYASDSDRMLNEMGDWWNTVKVMRGQVYDSCIVWPPNVETVLAINTCRHQLDLQNHWYQFTDDRWVGDHREFNRLTPGIVEFVNTSPVFRPVPDMVGILNFRISNSADVGKTVTVYGADENGLPQVQTLDLTAGGINSSPLKTVTHITKEVTAGEVRAYWFTPGTGITTLAGIYRPNDQSPEFRVSRWHVPSGCVPQITALCKLNAQPVVLDTDMLTVDCLDAHKEMFMGLRKREAGDTEGAIANEKEAVRRLNNQLRTRLPESQTVIEISSFGKNPQQQMSRHRIGHVF